MRSAHGSHRVPAERAASTYVGHRELFSRPCTEHKGYSDLYFARLNQLAPRVKTAVAERWGAAALEQQVKTLDAECDVAAVVIGTLYKDMSGKPSIVDELNRDALEQQAEAATPGTGKYCGPDDAMFIEDDSGRLAIRLSPKLASTVLVSGVVLAVRGKLNEAGELDVEDICFPALAPQRKLSQPGRQQPGAPSERFVALVSGLHVGHGAQDMLPLQLLTEHLTGQLGCDEDHHLQAKIVRLIIAGNATCDAMSASGIVGTQPDDPLKKMAAEEQRATAQSVRTLDQFLTTVSASMHVDLMPGADDPCNFLLPQQPLHHCMLPTASQLATFNSCTNPYSCDIDEVRFVGSSGQPLDDMQRSLPSDDRLLTLEQSLRFQHMAPTAPDTLGCTPY